MTDFESLMEMMVHELANPALPAGLEERVLARINASGMTVRLGAEVAAESVWASIWGCVRELMWPEKLPALVLVSRPMAVVDRMAKERSSRAMMGAVLAHALVILVIGLVVEARTGVLRRERPAEVVALDAPPLKLLVLRASASGGGSGQQGPTPVTRGHLPKFAELQIVPPKAPPPEQPRIALEPTVEVQRELKMADSVLPDIGMPNSPLVGMSPGNGRGGGLGPGSGDGFGRGANGGAGGGLRQVGGLVSEPKVLVQPEADYSEEARRAKFSGNVLVYLWVDEHGNPTHVRVARSVGLGLDEKAIEAVRQYRFRPAMESGKPVAVEMYVDVDFHIF